MKAILRLIIVILFSQLLLACHNQQHVATKTVEQEIKATAAIQHANEFADVYTKYCRYIKNLSELDEILIKSDTITPQKAKAFLGGHEGKGYVVSSVTNTEHDFIVLTANQLNMCVVVANNVDVYTVLQTFKDNHVIKVDSPIKIIQTKNSVEKIKSKTKSGTKTIIAYELQNHLNMNEMMSTELLTNGETQAIYSAIMAYNP